MDSNKIMNAEFNEIYDLMGDVENMIDTFYAKHALYGDDIDVNSDLFSQLKHLQVEMGCLRQVAHDIAERLT